MDLLLIRHGQAVDEAAGLGDAGRWLTAKGRKTTRRVARWLGKRNKRVPVAIWTSPLVRAVQTAEIVAAEAGFAGEVQVAAELTPGRDPGDLIRRLEVFEGPGPLALVGHEPFLSTLAAALLGRDLGGIRKSGVVGIEWAAGAGTLRFVFDPVEMKAQKVPRPPSEEPAPEPRPT